MHRLSRGAADRMLSSMFARLIAFAIAACIGVTGILPAGDGARCVAMDRRMAPGGDCCPKCDAVPDTAIRAPCCELVRGATLQARASAPTVEPRLAPAPLLLTFALADGQLGNDVSFVRLAAQARGWPPGDQIDRFSTILRI
ncbi:MAG: hypothetical protein JWN44_3508 [Myxococcales bacterium]|nr:hypothetical protein [Myxococcales bacterium]